VHARGRQSGCYRWPASGFEFSADSSVFSVGGNIERQDVDLAEQVFDSFKHAVDTCQDERCRKGLTASTAGSTRIDSIQAAFAKTAARIRIDQVDPSVVRKQNLASALKRLRSQRDLLRINRNFSLTGGIQRWLRLNGL
jgi:hypothetical protein